MAQSRKLSGEHPVRVAVRFPIKLPVIIETSNGLFKAITEDISANGILFTSDSLPDVDTRVQFTLCMPAAIMGSGTDITLHCVGRIVRHQLDGVAKKAAIVLDTYTLKAG